MEPGGQHPVTALVPGVTSSGSYVHQADTVSTDPVTREFSRHRPHRLRRTDGTNARGGTVYPNAVFDTYSRWDRGLVDRRVPVSCLGDERPWYGYRLASKQVRGHAASNFNLVVRQRI